MEAVLDRKNESIKKVLYVLIAFVVFFTTSDIVLGFTNNLLFASICSIISGFLVFSGSFIKSKSKIESEIDRGVQFIKKNFDWCNIILSILDIICSVIALFTGIFFIGLIFRCAFAVRLVVLCNKFKTVVRAIMIAAFVYLFKRRKDKKEKNTMENEIVVKSKKLSKTQIISIVIAVVGVAFGILSYFLPVIRIAGEQIYNYAMALGIESVAAIVGTLKGYSDRTQEEIEKIKKKAEANKEKQAAAKAKAEQAALEKVAKAELKAEEKAAAKAELEKVKAEREAKLAEEKAEAEKAEADKKVKIEEIKAQLKAAQQKTVE